MKPLFFHAFALALGVATGARANAWKKSGFILVSDEDWDVTPWSAVGESGYDLDHTGSECQIFRLIHWRPA